MDAGHRGLRRRTIGRASAGTAFVLVAALGGYGLSTMNPSSALDVAGSPTPRASTPESPSRSTTVLTLDSVTDERPGSSADYETVNVTANANGSFTFTPGETEIYEMRPTKLAGLEGEVFVGIASGNRPIHLNYTDAAGEWHTIKP